MKKRKLNFRGKVLVTILIILASAIIYVLMAKLGAFANCGIIYQLLLFCGWAWLIIGQMSAYLLLWGDEN